MGGKLVKANSRLLVGFCLATALALQGCTVRPLYSSAPATATGDATMTAELASIAVKPVTTREAQQVRNQLVFLFYGGAAEPGAAVYSLDLKVTTRRDVTTSTQVTTIDEEPSSASVTVIGNYRLTRIEGGEVVATGRRQVASSYDIPAQQYAALRAGRDAEDRAARELAELLRLAIAQDIARQ
jgi:LPS-assembly lipoprotein